MPANEPSMKSSVNESLPTVENPASDYGIAAALTETLEAAIVADGNASLKAYELIERYAYGDNPGDSTKLRMANFTMRDGNGNTQELSIPLITMLPLPLLHVSEASFELDLDVALHSSAEEEISMNSDAPTSALASQLSRYDALIANYKKEINRIGFRIRKLNESFYGPSKSGKISRTQYSEKIDQLNAEFNRLTSLRNKLFLDRERAARMQPSTATTNGASFIVSKNSKEQNTSTTHITAKVKMEQFDMPDGIRALLQAAANSLSVKTTNQ